MLIYGLPGMGKTTFMHDYIRQFPDHRYFIVDHAEEWEPNAIHWRGNPPKMTIVNGASDVPKEFEPTGVYVFREMEGLDVAQLVCDVGNAVYVDDEIDLVARRQGWDESPLRKLVHQGRHLRNAAGDITECHLIGACRRPQSLHNDLSEQADAVYIFRVQGMNTMERMRKDSHIEPAEEDTIRELPKFHFKAWPANEFLEIPPIGDAQPDPAAVAEMPPQREDADEDESPFIRFW